MWCYLLPYLTLHAIDESHWTWQNYKEIWLVAEVVRFLKEIKTKSLNLRLKMNLNHHALTLTASSSYATVTYNALQTYLHGNELTEQK